MKKMTAGLLLAIASLTANADPIAWSGSTIGYQYLHPDIATIYAAGAPGSDTSFVVGAGVELTAIITNTPYGSIDLADGVVDIDYYGADTWTPSSFNGFRLYDIGGTIEAITSVTVDASTQFGAFQVTFDSENIWVNWQGTTFDANSFIRLNVNGADATSVPEPASFGLVGLALLTAGAARRKRS